MFMSTRACVYFQVGLDFFVVPSKPMYRHCTFPYIRHLDISTHGVEYMIYAGRHHCQPNIDNF